MPRRAVALAIGVALALAVLPPAQARDLAAQDCRDDHRALAKALEAYPYPVPATVRRAREAASPRVAAARTAADCARALGAIVEAYHDDAVALSGEDAARSRSVPAETDIWARLEGGTATVLAVRPGSAADAAGVHPGLAIASVQGVAIDRAVREKAGTARGDADIAWALNHVLAGPREGAYVIGTRGKGPRSLEIVRQPAPATNGAPILARRIGERRDIAYVRIRNTLGDAGLTMHFDAALQQMRDTRAMILDLRDTPAGGDESVARAILGRFIATPTPWQAHAARGKPPVTDSADPRGPFAYRAPLVVLVDRWTAAEGEALAAALATATGATLIGTEMAGIRGRAGTVTLAHTGLVLRYPAERALDAVGKPRESLRPHVAVDLLAPSGGPGDPILYAGLKHLEK